MRHPAKLLLVAVLLSAGLMAAGGAQGQQMQHGPGTMGHHMMGPGYNGYGMMGPGMMMYGPAVDARLAYLKAELGITDAQSSAWTGYVTAVKARVTTMQGTHQAMMQAWQSGTATTRLDAHTKAMEGMVETLKALKPATEALYAVLTTEQKAKADVLLGMGCCMM